MCKKGWKDDYQDDINTLRVSNGCPKRIPQHPPPQPAKKSQDITEKTKNGEKQEEPKDVGSDKFDKKPSVARVTFGNMTALNRLSSHGGTFQIKSVRKVRCFFLGVCGWN